MFQYTVYGGNGLGSDTQTAGTVINRLVPARVGAFSRITKLVYTAGATAHTVYAMRSLGRTTLSADAAASQAVINLTAEPGPSGNTIAANDYVAIRQDNGAVIVAKVSSVSSLAVTLTANLSVAISAGASVWFFGVAGDTDPKTTLVHPKFTGTASVTTSYSDDAGGVVASHAKDEPILVQSNNATNAGVIEQVSYTHTLK